MKESVLLPMELFGRYMWEVQIKAETYKAWEADV